MRTSNSKRKHTIKNSNHWNFKLRQLIFILGITLSTSTLANDSFKVNVLLDYPPGIVKSAEYSSSASNLFKRCQSMLPEDKKWSDVITTKSSTPKADIWTNAWNEFAHKQQNELYDIKGEDPKKLLNFYTKFNADLAKLQRDIASCEAMRSLTKGSDYTDPESTISGKSSLKQSVDGKIKCGSAGPETQDYKACLKALNVYNGALVGTAVFTQVQTVKYQGDSFESAAGLNPNDPTASLKAQKNDIESRAQLTNQRAGLDMAKAAGLWTFMEKIPDHSDLKSRCNADATGGNPKISYDHIRNKTLEIINNFYNIDFPSKNQSSLAPQNPAKIITLTLNKYDGNQEELPLYNAKSTPGQLESEIAEKVRLKYKRAKELMGTKLSITKYCDMALNTPELLLNGPARQGLKAAMIAAGIDGVKHKVTADQLNKQANQVGKVIDDVNNFDPSQLPEFQGQDFQGSECALNPSADGCDEFIQERSFGFQDSSPIQIHGMENASSFKRGDRDTNTTGDNDSEDSTGPSGAPKTVGSFDRRVAKNSGFEGRMPGKADVSSDGPSAGGGGGGGGGSAGGGGSPPASQVQQPQGEQGPRMNNAGNSRAAYSGGGGSLRRSGGGGAMGSRDSGNDDKGNPFDKLFGDKDPTQSETLNFRETASGEAQINTPDTSIFEIISDRYVNVQKQDRLLEYKIQNADELQ